MKFLLFLIFMLVLIVPEIAHAVEISAMPEKELFGPNEQIRIFVEIQGYSGGDIMWTATQPDGNIIEGVFSNIKASKTNHTISRNAFDGQFGIWEIQYEYKDILKKINVEVEPLVVSVTTDQLSYTPKSTAIIRISTNYYNPIAANAETMTISILDEEGNLVQSVDGIKMKVYQPVIIQHFLIDELLQNNPFGVFHAIVTYYGITVDAPFEITNPDSDTSIFLSSNKPVYFPNDPVELNFVMPEIPEKSGKLHIKLPSGQIITKIIPITQSLTRITLNDVDTSKNGTYSLQFEYGFNKTMGSFQVYDKSQEESKISDLEIQLSLNKIQYQPGEIMQVTISANKISNEQIIYWFEDSSGNQGNQFSFLNPTSGTFSLSHVVPSDFIHGPSKLHLKYGATETFALFFVAGETIEVTENNSNTQYEDPEIVHVLDNKVASFSKISDISTSLNQELFVLDSGDKKVKIFDEKGNLKKTWDILDNDETQIINPTSMFVEDSVVHITDIKNSKIITFDKNGNFIREWGNSGIDYQSIQKPTDIAVDDTGMYFVSDENQGKVLKYTKNGAYAGEINSLLTASAKFSSIKSITTNEDNVFLLSEENNRILHFLNSGEFVKSFGTEGQSNKQFQDPVSIKFSANDYLYVADSGNNRVIVMNTQGGHITKWGTFGNAPGQFDQMIAIDVDSNGDVWVADSNGIQKFASILESKNKIPEWVKNNAGWWADDQIDQESFVSGIQYLIKEKIIPIVGKTETTNTSEEIPEWVKNNAGWWAEGIISEDDFINGIKYLVEKGIVQIS